MITVPQGIKKDYLLHFCLTVAEKHNEGKKIDFDFQENLESFGTIMRASWYEGDQRKFIACSLE